MIKLTPSDIEYGIDAITEVQLMEIVEMNL